MDRFYFFRTWILQLEISAEIGLIVEWKQSAME